MNSSRSRLLLIAALVLAIAGLVGAGVAQGKKPVPVPLLALGRRKQRHRRLHDGPLREGLGREVADVDQVGPGGRCQRGETDDHAQADAAHMRAPAPESGHDRSISTPDRHFPLFRAAAKGSGASKPGTRLFDLGAPSRPELLPP